MPNVQVHSCRLAVGALLCNCIVTLWVVQITTKGYRPFDKRTVKIVHLLLIVHLIHTAV